jgi:hypothetical protein
MEKKVYSIDGKELRTINLDDKVFGLPINEDVIEERTKMKAIEFYKHIYAELPKHYTPNTILAEL